MIEKTIAFDDFDGNRVVETHYFHLSKKELIEMELGGDQTISSKYEKLLAAKDATGIMKAYYDLISAAYGKREGPTVFRKSNEISEAFLQSLAFEALLDELLTSDTAASEFVMGILPADMEKLAEKVAAKELKVSQGGKTTPQVTAGTPSTYHEENELSGLQFPRDQNDELVAWAFRDPTTKEQMEMEKFQLVDVMRRRSSGWEPR